jgi:hypothetical protein
MTEPSRPPGRPPPARTPARRAAALAALLLALAAPARPDTPRPATPRPAEPPAAPAEPADAVTLPREEYRKQQDEREQLRRQLAAAQARPQAPSVCRLSGRVEGRGGHEAAVLTAAFEFRTAAPKAVVLVGCGKAGLTGAKLDGGLPDLRAPAEGGEGYTALVEAPGDHTLTLDLELPLTAEGPTGSERGFRLDLPAAAITRLERLALPAGVARARIVRTQPGAAAPPPLQVSAADLAPPDNAPPPAALLGLGPVSRLEVTWEGPAAGDSGEPLLAADGQVRVRVEETALTSTATLELSVRRGRAAEWPLQLPADADVTLVNPPADLGATLVRPDPKKPVWVVRLREPSAEKLRVEVQSRLARKKLDRGPFPVGPFAVRGAASQRGTVTVSAAPALRVVPHPDPAGDLQRQGDDAGPDLVFAYGSLPRALDGTPLPPLKLSVEPARGAVRVQSSHALALDTGGWKLASEFRVTPYRAELDRVELEVPAELQSLKALPPEVVEALEPGPDAGPGRRTWTVRLAGSRHLPFAFTLEGFYPVPPARPEASLLLPRPPRAQAQETGQVTVSAPEGWELRAAVREWDRDKVGESDRPLQPAAGAGRAPSLTYASTQAAPARVDLAWRAHRPDLPVSVTADLALSDRQAKLTEQLHFRFPAGPPRSVPLRAPAGLETRVQLVQGGRLSLRGPGELVVTPPADAGREYTLTLEYLLPGPAEGGPAEAGGLLRPGRLSVPLVWPESATRCETRLRVWNEAAGGPGLAPVPAEGPWEERPPEVVPERKSLPVLVLHGSGTGLGLVLRLEEPAGRPRASAVVERVLVQASPPEPGEQAYRYRARFLLRRLAARSLDLELPAAATLDLSLYLDGRLVKTWLPVADNDPGGGQVVRLRVDAADPGRAQVLEARYRLPAWRVDGGGGRASRWEAVFLPPRLRDAVFVGPLRWQLADLPGAVTPVTFTAGAALEQRWVWHAGLLTARPARTGADLEQWFRDGQELPGADDAEAAGGTGWVVRAAAPEPLRLVLVPRTAGLLAVSLVVLAAGLGLFALRRRPLAAGAMAVGLAAALVAAALLWPQPTAVALAAGQPGLVVLGLVFLGHWFLQKRYRRKVVFLPGFKRVKTGSSLMRGGSGRPQPAREPSTIDAPPPSGSDAAWATGGSGT